MYSIIVFASGGGSNAKALYQYGKKTNTFSIATICSDKEEPGVKAFALENNIPFHHIPAKEMASEHTFHLLQPYNASLIVLAGYLRLVPLHFINFFNSKIVNIHPALLPKYGGKGMYGHFVHEAVVAAQDWQSGLTIHWVTPEYDKGAFIKQVHVPVYTHDTAEMLAQRVLQQEHYWYPRVVAELLKA
jgi:phosphoribosylglycinamide formyltransferase 1